MLLEEHCISNVLRFCPDDKMKKCYCNMENLTFKNKWQKFWWEVFSEDGKPSSKRIVGGIMIFCTQVCLVIEFALHGANTMVKDLFEVNLIIGASLLGLSNITSIWKGGKIAVGNNPPKLKEEKETEE